MKIRRFYGKDMREALNQVKEELGSEAVIMSTRKQDNGIELVAAYDKEPIAVSSVKASKPTPTLSEIIGDSGPDSLRELLEKQQSSPEIAQKKRFGSLKSCTQFKPKVGEKLASSGSVCAFLRGNQQQRSATRSCDYFACSIRRYES
jgi:flagellar biosynthesis protein FlhF